MRKLKTIVLLLICAAEVLCAFSCGKDPGPDEPAVSTEVTSDAPESTAPDTEEQIPPTVTGLIIPDDNKTPSHDFAMRLLEICTGYSKSSSASLLTAEGFEVVMQKNFEKADEDRSHTSAYTVGCGTVSFRGKTRDAVIITVRGTKEGEWYSNFDIAPSHSNDTQYAENFLAAAQDVYSGVKPIIDGKDNPVIIVCGHSRGAATSNLLGEMLCAECDGDALFVYTFATPTTARKSGDFPFIFNYINPADIVTLLPPGYMGFVRLGTDIILDGDEERINTLNSVLDSFREVAPDIKSYYEKEYTITMPGLSYVVSMTVYDVMLAVGDVINTGDTNSLGLLALLPSDSGLYPLVQTLGSLDLVSSGSEISRQHTPQRYADLISSLN